MGFIIGAGLVFAVCMVLAFLMRRLEETRQWRWVPLVAGLAIPVILVGCAGARTVDTGHVGVQTLFGKIVPGELAAGLHFVNPLVEINQISIQIHKDESKYEAATQDMQNVHVSMIMNFQVRPEKATFIYENYREEVFQRMISPAAQEVLKAETAKHKANEILHNRQQIKRDVQKSIAEWLDKYGVQLIEIAISNVQFDPEYAQAIETKQIQEQQAAQKEYELLKAQREAEIVAAKAKGEADSAREASKGAADAAREAAKGRADALKIEAEAQSEYNRKVAESLSPIFVQAEFIRRWDGKLPVYAAGGAGGAGNFFVLPTPAGK